MLDLDERIEVKLAHCDIHVPSEGRDLPNHRISKVNAADELWSGIDLDKIICPAQACHVQDDVEEEITFSDNLVADELVAGQTQDFYFAASQSAKERFAKEHQDSFWREESLDTELCLPSPSYTVNTGSASRTLSFALKDSISSSQSLSATPLSRDRATFKYQEMPSPNLLNYEVSPSPSGHHYHNYGGQGAVGAMPPVHFMNRSPAPPDFTALSMASVLEMNRRPSARGIGPRRAPSRGQPQSAYQEMRGSPLRIRDCRTM